MCTLKVDIGREPELTRKVKYRQVVASETTGQCRFIVNYFSDIVETQLSLSVSTLM